MPALLKSDAVSLSSAEHGPDGPQELSSAEDGPDVPQELSSADPDCHQKVVSGPDLDPNAVPSRPDRTDLRQNARKEAVDC
ncbi:hypothetical protein WMY93_020063 [Mugilogobius chulae]|uniref:Uncharacterized protein n=1 Tax=Mugilogobius chulae TaxID=88201 RepID=A0AAW0NKY6_9GOBI